MVIILKVYMRQLINCQKKKSIKSQENLPKKTHKSFIGIRLLKITKESCKISGVLYLKVPEQIESSSKNLAIKGGKDGQIVFTGMGGADPF